MSATVYELIGQIIDPRPAAAPSPGPAPSSPLRSESVEELIGRIIYPGGRPETREEQPVADLPVPAAA